MPCSRHAENPDTPYEWIEPDFALDCLCDDDRYWPFQGREDWHEIIVVLRWFAALAAVLGPILYFIRGANSYWLLSLPIALLSWWFAATLRHILPRPPYRLATAYPPSSFTHLKKS